MKYQLPDLKYDYNALEPHIDAKTMEIHYTKHHQGYVDKLNAVLEKYPDLHEKDLSQLLTEVDHLDMEDVDKVALRNNGGGHINHSLFWDIMGSKKEINESLKEAIIEQFGSLDTFKEQFNSAALTRFGSGWAWLVRDENNTLQIYSTANQDSPYANGHEPIICLDVWEHAYYLQYQNKRPDYVNAWWNVMKLF